jgi:hypothetical protein
MNHCCHVSDQSDNFRKCYDKTKFGDYCHKHRSTFLLDENQLIIQTRFTGKSKDYYVKDIRRYCKEKILLDAKGLSGKKNDIFQVVVDAITTMNYYETHVKSLIVVQSLFRGNRVRTLLRERQTCNNTEDFFTFDPIPEIQELYFYSYQDLQGLRWGFDIRSFHKLLSLNYPNPYTTEVIPESVITAVRARLSLIKKSAPYEDIVDIIVRDRKATIKQMTVDLFSKIEQSGYTCHIEWFTDLSVRRLKILYKDLEDIWNYRAQLTNHMKKILCPPDGRIFTANMSQVMNYQVKEDLQELILSEIQKFTGCQVEANRKLGYMYFIIGFGRVSNECYVAHQDWLNFVE